MVRRVPSASLRGDRAAVGRFCAVVPASAALLTCMKVTVAEPVSQSQGVVRCVASPLCSAWANDYRRRQLPDFQGKQGGSMSRTFRVTAVAAVAAFVLSMPVFAGQAKPAAKTAKAAKTMTVSGTLQKVEGQDLTIQTAKGS